MEQQTTINASDMFNSTMDAKEKLQKLINELEDDFQEKYPSLTFDITINKLVQTTDDCKWSKIISHINLSIVQK